MTYNSITTCSGGYLVPELGQAQKCGVHKLFNGDPNYSPLDNWIPNDNPDINILEVL